MGESGGTKNPLYEDAAASKDVTAGGSVIALSPLETALRAVIAIGENSKTCHDDAAAGNSAARDEYPIDGEIGNSLHAQHDTPSQLRADSGHETPSQIDDSPLCWSLETSQADPCRQAKALCGPVARTTRLNSCLCIYICRICICICCLYI